MKFTDKRPVVLKLLGLLGELLDRSWRRPVIDRPEFAMLDMGLQQQARSIGAALE